MDGAVTHTCACTVSSSLAAVAPCCTTFSSMSAYTWRSWAAIVHSSSASALPLAVSADGCSGGASETGDGDSADLIWSVLAAVASLFWLSSFCTLFDTGGTMDSEVSVGNTTKLSGLFACGRTHLDPSTVPRLCFKVDNSLSNVRRFASMSSMPSADFLLLCDLFFCR